MQCFLKNYFCIIKKEQAFPDRAQSLNGGFTMKEKQLLKAIEILAGRVLELENDLTVSQYRIDNLREIIEKAESEAGK
jgi:hypothetical protein